MLLRTSLAIAAVVSASVAGAAQIPFSQKFPHYPNDVDLDVAVSNELTTCGSVNVDWSSTLKDVNGLTFSVAAHATDVDNQEELSKEAFYGTWRHSRGPIPNEIAYADQEFTTPAKNLNWTVDYPAGTRIQFFVTAMSNGERYYGSSPAFIVGEGQSSSCVTEIHKPVTIEWPTELTSCDVAVARWTGGNVAYSFESDAGGIGRHYHRTDATWNPRTGTHAVGYYEGHHPVKSWVTLTLVGDYSSVIATRRYRITRNGKGHCSANSVFHRSHWNGRPFALVGVVLSAVLGGLVLAVTGYFLYRFALHKIRERRGIKLDSPPPSPTARSHQSV
ncbi:hypothetical protein JCM6882_006121 [Rhodosporidiobolus microsporus]